MKYLASGAVASVAIGIGLAAAGFVAPLGLLRVIMGVVAAVLLFAAIAAVFEKEKPKTKFHYAVAAENIPAGSLVFYNKNTGKIHSALLQDPQKEADVQ